MNAQRGPLLPTIVAGWMLINQANPSYGQARNANWLTIGNWINFNSGVPENTAPPPSTSPGSAISDTSGQLQAYVCSYGFSGEPGIRDENHSLIANQPPQWSIGNGLDAPQASIFIPRPGTSSQAYLCVWYRYGPAGWADLRFGSIPIELGSTGVEPAVLDTGFTWFMQQPACKRTVVPHANGADYWFIAQQVQSDLFHAYLITNSGFSNQPVMSQAGSLIPSDWVYGKMIASSQGDRFASVAEPSNYDWSTVSSTMVEVFDLDPLNGTIQLLASLPGIRRAKGLEFSPSGRYLYVAEHHTPPGLSSPRSRKLYQYDLEAADIAASQTLVSSYPVANVYLGPGNVLALGPDGKIYEAQELDQDTLGVITDPDLSAPLCNYVHHGFRCQTEITGLPAPIKQYHGDPGIGSRVSNATPTALFHVFPNPVVSELRLQGLPPEPMSLVLRDITGQVVLEVTSCLGKIHVKDLPCGVYIIEVQDKRSVRMGVARFVKE